ncbi:MAG: hypothetical protein AVO38_15075 [delta proteobacterium ML8_D]|jgi:flagellar motor switch protein FliM|nr:MAG: hypothetical protein AVO38_15075 [delta proteobacterium ML8_D]
MKEEYIDAKVFTIKKHTPVLDDFGEHLNINQFDFKRPSKFTKDHIRIIDMMHNSFARLVESRLSILTRNVTDVSLVMTEQKTFGEYISGLSELSLITTLHSSIFDGDVVLQFTNEILFVLLDRVLGGDGASSISREFTDIELILIENILKEYVDAIKEAWVNIEKMDLQVKEIETNPQFARPVANSEMCLVLNFRIASGEKKGYFTFCLPYLSIKTILNKLDARSWFEDSHSISRKKGDKKIIENMMKVRLDAKVILGEAEIPFININDIEAGDVIMLNKKINENLDMVVGDKKIFNVQAGKISKRIAVQIAKIKDSED